MHCADKVPSSALLSNTRQTKMETSVEKVDKPSAQGNVKESIAVAKMFSVPGSLTHAIITFRWSGSHGWPFWE